MTNVQRLRFVRLVILASSFFRHLIFVIRDLVEPLP